MQTIKIVVDKLSIIGRKHDQEDILDVVLNELDQNSYNPSLMSFMQDTIITFNELHEKLINHKLALTQQTHVTGIYQPATAFNANHQSTKKSWLPRQNSTTAALLPTPSQASQTTGQHAFLGNCQWFHKKNTP